MLEVEQQLSKMTLDSDPVWLELELVPKNTKISVGEA